MRSIEQDFIAAMLALHEKAKSEIHGYNPTKFLQLIKEFGGIHAAKILINVKGVPEGLRVLWEKKRLDLSTEALIVENPKYHQLFTEAEIKLAKTKLITLGYQFQDPQKTGKKK